MSSQPDFFIDKSAAALDEEARKVKRTKDYTAEVAALVPQVLADFRKDKTKFQDAINTLLPVEKKTRLASDVESTSIIAKTILQVSAEAKQWGVLCDQLTYLVKCRAQLIAVIKAVVSYSLSIVQTDIIPESVVTTNTTTTTTATTNNTMGDDVDTKNTITAGLDFDTKMQILTTIITVSDGKLCVEYEHATATVLKANMVRDKNDVNATKESYTLITTIPAEVIGSMSYYEKCTTILNQVSLAIENSDYTQATILLKKIRLSELNKYVELKYFYYVLQARIHYYNESWLDACRAYYQLFLHLRTTQQGQQEDKSTTSTPAPKTTTNTTTTTPDVSTNVISKEYAKTVLSTLYKINIDEIFDIQNQSESQQQSIWQPWLQRAIIAGALAPYDYESEQQLALIATQDQYVTKCGPYATLLNHFNSKQIIFWPISQSPPASLSPQYDAVNQRIALKDELEKDSIFVFKKSTTSMGDDGSDNTTASSNEDKKWTLLRQRVIQHDIRILSKAFSQLSFTQASQLLCVNIEELELELASLATQLGLRLDRRFELINFVGKKDTGVAVLSSWADDLTELFNLVENTEQFIQKVRAVHQMETQ